METGTHREVSVEGLAGDILTIAVDSEGAIYAYDHFDITPETVARSVMARLDPTTSQWTTTILETDIEFPFDMDFKPDGNLIVGGEFRIYDIDLTARTVELSDVRRTGDFGKDAGPIAVEIDSAGTIITGGRDTGDDTAILFRQTVEAQVAERFETGIFLSDFAFDSNGMLIGVGSSFPARVGKLYRLNFDTKSVDLLFESDLLAGARKITLDPAGRIVALTHPSGPLRRIVRVDLGLGTAELITELEGLELSDMDLRIIPEPPSVELVLVGFLVLSVCFLRWHVTGLHSSSRH
jgi:hypothetical protein